MEIVAISLLTFLMVFSSLSWILVTNENRISYTRIFMVFVIFYYYTGSIGSTLAYRSCSVLALTSKIRVFSSIGKKPSSCPMGLSLN
jgi:hypothetical protein